MTENFALLEQYLKIDTNYAVIINGKYGIGKTHYFKEVLYPKIKDVSTPHNENKKYHPIHISLFGLKSIEEIESAIYMEIFPLLKNKNIQLGTSLLKVIIRGAAALKGINLTDELLEGFRPETIKPIYYDKLVICFDDLDRKSSSLDLNDVFGFINSLVENEGTKILIIANDQDFIKEHKEIYERVKEKVVGVSIEFEQNIEVAYKEIVASKYKSEKVYHEFLSNNSAKIIKVVKDNDDNLRTLIFFLEHFRLIYSSLNIEFQKNKKFNWKKQEKIDAILNFSLAIIFEYKTGRLNTSNFVDVQDLKDIVWWKSSNFKSLLGNGSTEDESVSFIDNFRTRYFAKTTFYYFDSVFQYIIGRKFFCFDSLKIELIEYFGEQKEDNLLKIDVMDRLAYMECFYLSQSEYRKATFKMLQIAYKGNYPLNLYPTIFHYASRFNNILNFDIQNLINKLKIGIDKCTKKSLYIERINRLMYSHVDIEFSSHVKEITDYCIEKNNSIKEKLKSDLIKDFFASSDHDFMKFVNTSSHADSDFYAKPFWHKMNSKKVMRKIHELNNLQLWDLSDYFKERYRMDLINDLLLEKTFIIQLREHLESSNLSRQKKNLRNFSLDRLKDTLRSCIDLFNNK